ncbi:O-Antigen ligase [Sporotomaculum syntrophicum]|uniref:O-Antigen ligase n=1 Tax=Sporotomaculum syntrophicum TaxID=182264 RepID=A0A9D2WRV7_9FIRM|nr:O-antigen ligase family protein [Sporotomaculum syntrophicum]KAF1085953.1 O-Antigen ligase [Sporotomaculum syntrophicum]
MKEFIVKYWIEGAFLLYIAALVVSVALNSLIPAIAMTALFLIAVILWQPLWGFCLMVFFIPLENVTLLLPGLTLHKAIGVVTFISWLLHLIVGKKAFKLNGFVVLLVLYLLWCLLTVVWAIQPERSLSRIVSSSQLLLMVVLGYNLVDNRKELYLILGSFLLGAFLASCLGIYNSYLNGFALRADIGSMTKPNYFARVAGLGVIFSAYLIIASKNKFIRLFSLIGCNILTVAVLLSGSRGAWVALLLAAAVALYSAKKNIIEFIRTPIVLKSLLVIILFIITLGPLITNHTPPVITQRLQTVAGTATPIDISAGRLDIWLVGLEIVKDNWAWGVGLDNFPYAFTEYLPRVDNIRADIGLNRDPHNIILANLAELGLPGLLIFMALLVFLWRLGGRTEKLEDSLLCRVTVVFLFIAGLTSTDHCSKYFWFGMLIPIIVSQFYYFKNNDRDKSMAKVIFLTAIFPNRFNPNYGIFSLRLVQHLKSIGVPVTVVAPVPYAPPFLWLKKNG